MALVAETQLPAEPGEQAQNMCMQHFITGIAYQAREDLPCVGNHLQQAASSLAQDDHPLHSGAQMTGPCPVSFHADDVTKEGLLAAVAAQVPEHGCCKARRHPMSCHIMLGQSSLS